MIMSWRPEARCHFKPGDANWNWKRDTNTSPWPGRGGVSPPGWLTPLTPVSHNLPAIIIPHHAPWLVKVDNSLNKTRNVIHRNLSLSVCFSSTCLRSLPSARVLITVVAVLISGPALQSSAHCLIRANLLERQYLGYGPILRISICPWQALTGNIFIRKLSFMESCMALVKTIKQKEKHLGQQFSLSSWVYIYMTTQLFLDLDTFKMRLPFKIWEFPILNTFCTVTSDTLSL